MSIASDTRRDYEITEYTGGGKLPVYAVNGKRVSKAFYKSISDGPLHNREKSCILIRRLPSGRAIRSCIVRIK